MSLQDIHDIYAEPHIKSVEIKVSDGTTLGNKDIVTEKFELQDSLNSANELVFGSCEAACLKLQVAADTGKIFKDLWLDVWATIQDNSGDLMIDNEHYLLMSDGSKMRMHPYISSTRVGRFKVVLDEPVSDRSWRNLTCYDAMYDILRAEVADWYKGLTFPMTVKALRDSFFAYLDIEQEDTTLIHDSLVVQGNFVASSKLTGRTIIKAICELGGVFGHINKDGKMDYISIPSDESVEYPYYRDGTGSYERDMVEPITGIIARDSEDDAGTTIGTMTNPYIITGNPLVFGIEGTQELEDALTALLAKIGGITYRPFAVTSFGNPALPIGTSIILNTRDITIESFIETRRLTGVQGLKDTISAKGNKERLNDTIDLSSELYQTDGRYHLLRNDVNGLESEVFDEQGNSKIEQISNEIVLKVDSNGKVVDVALSADPDTGTAFKVLADNIDFISNGNMQLTSKSIGISSTYFSVATDGKITSTGGTIGGWSITTNALYYGVTSETDNTHDGIYLGNSKLVLQKKDTGFNTMQKTVLSRNALSTWYITMDGYDDQTLYYMGFSLNHDSAYALFSHLIVSGSKSRVVETDDFGKRLLYCYETPTPMFGDMGEGKIAEDGKCYIMTESIFNQTISDVTYQVFLQKYGEGECYVTERKPNYFVVEGTIGLKFGWEIKAKQAGYEMNRLDKFEKLNLPKQNYGNMAEEHLVELKDEREVVA